MTRPETTTIAPGERLPSVDQSTIADGDPFAT